MSSETILIVGAGLAGVTAAGTLREAGFGGRVILASDEREIPYDRPPLSKSVLVHDEFESLVAAHLPEDIALRAPEQIALRPAGWFEQQNIELRLGARVTSIDPAEHRVQLDGGASLEYSRMILATGARVRRLAGFEPGTVPVMYLRTLRDALNLRRALRPGRRIVLLGGGVIGMEVAASAVLRDCDVTVVELAPRIMGRALCEPISDFVAQYHRRKGVKLRLNCAATGQADGATPGLRLQDGTVIAADLIVIGIGIVPNVQLAEAAALECHDGIVVNEFGATSAPDIFAAGDAVHYPDSFFGRGMRSENWMHAQYQAMAVAKNAAGASAPYVQTPHMWSDQYDLKIQVTGRYDTPTQVERGERAKNRFMLLHLAGGKVVGATGINESRDMKFAQRLIEAAAPVDTAKLADPAFNLKKAGGA